MEEERKETKWTLLLVTLFNKPKGDLDLCITQVPVLEDQLEVDLLTQSPPYSPYSTLPPTLRVELTEDSLIPPLALT